MEQGAPNTGLHAVVIGSDEDGYVERTVESLLEHGVGVTRCEDVYAAAAKLPQLGRGRVLAVGRVEELKKEGGRFFRIAGRNGFVCCCLVDSDAFGGHDWGGLWQLEGGGGFVIDGPMRIAEVIRRLREEARGGRGARGALDHINDQKCHASRAEIEALLGLWIDDRSQRS